MQELFRQFMNDESGQGLVEYALIIVLVSIAVIVALGALATQLNLTFGEAKTAITKP